MGSWSLSNKEWKSDDLGLNQHHQNYKLDNTGEGGRGGGRISSSGR